jgi:hypothetical protein
LFQFPSNPLRRSWAWCGRSAGKKKEPYTTICLRARRGLRMNLRVRRVTGASAMIVVVVGLTRLNHQQRE